jgi:hypothetical protein
MIESKECTWRITRNTKKKRRRLEKQGTEKMFILLSSKACEKKTEVEGTGVED